MSHKPWHPLNPVMGGVLLSIFMVALFWHYYLQAITPPDDIFKIEKIAFQAEKNAEK